MNSPVMLRDAEGSDVNFIYDTFLKSMKSDSVLGRSSRKSLFFKDFSQVIDHILSKSKTIVACLSEDKNVIIGYAIFDSQALHYIFVKEAFRKLGIAKDLCAHAFPESEALTYSLCTGQAWRILKNKPQHTYNPLILFKKGA